MIRISALNDAAVCSLRPQLAAEGPGEETEASEIGTAFHRAVARRSFFVTGALGPSVAKELMGMLELLWSSHIVIPAHAVFEQRVALDVDGLPCSYDDPEALIRGTFDCGWIDDGVATVVDWKSGFRPVAPAASNLQLAGYGLAFAALHEIDRLSLGIYYARRGEWDWAYLTRQDMDASWRRIRDIATKPPVAHVGPGCNDCRVYQKCPTVLWPADPVARDIALVPLTNAGLVTQADVMRLLHASTALKKLSTAGLDYVKNWVTTHGPLESDDQIYNGWPTKGRETASVEGLRKAGLYDQAVAAGAVKTGEPGERFEWRRR